MKRPLNVDEDFEEEDGYISPVEEMKRDSKKEREDRILRERILHEDPMIFSTDHLLPGGKSVIQLYTEKDDPFSEKNRILWEQHFRGKEDPEFKRKFLEEIRQNRYEAFGIPKSILDKYSKNIFTNKEVGEIFELLKAHGENTDPKIYFLDALERKITDDFRNPSELLELSKIPIWCIVISFRPYDVDPERHPRKESGHAVVLFCIPSKQKYVLYDSSKIIKTRANLRHAIFAFDQMCNDNKLFLINIIDANKIDIYEPKRQFEHPFHERSCSTFVVWNSLWLALNPKTYYKKQENPPLIINYDVEGFRQFMRYCLANHKIDLTGLPNQWIYYTGGWKKKPSPARRIS